MLPNAGAASGRATLPQTILPDLAGTGASFAPPSATSAAPSANAPAAAPAQRTP